MIRKSFALRAATSNEADPYRLLGVTAETPFNEIRQRFYTLTQQLHPDMPHGDAVRFRAINAAYRQLRALHRRRENGEVRGSSANASASSSRWDHYYSNHHSHPHASNASHARKAAYNNGTDAYESTGQDFRWTQATSASTGPWRHKTASSATSSAGTLSSLEFSSIELIVTLVSIGAAVLYGIQRYITVWRLVQEKQERQHRIDVGLPPPMPTSIDDAWQKAYSVPPKPEEHKMDTERVIDAIQYRRATQRRFDDFREFMFVYDSDNIGERRVSSARFSRQYVDESSIGTRCPLVREFDSRLSETNYNAIASDVQKTIAEASWWQRDAGVAGALLAKGLNCVPSASPNTAKWTFIEYADTGRKHAYAEPVCLLALRNLRYDDVGVCQRVVVTGNAKLIEPNSDETTATKSHATSASSRFSCDAGGSKNASALRGLPVPLKNTEIPLEKMQL